jgi:hypothetical protein
MNDLTEQFLVELYEKFAAEQQKVLQDIKTGCDAIKEADNHKQISLLHTLMLTSLKLRNLKQKIKNRMD